MAGYFSGQQLDQFVREFDERRFLAVEDALSIPIDSFQIASEFLEGLQVTYEVDTNQDSDVKLTQTGVTSVFSRSAGVVQDWRSVCFVQFLGTSIIGVERAILSNPSLSMLGGSVFQRKVATSNTGDAPDVDMPSAPSSGSPPPHPHNPYNGPAGASLLIPPPSPSMSSVHTMSGANSILGVNPIIFSPISSEVSFGIGSGIVPSDAPSPNNGGGGHLRANSYPRSRSAHSDTRSARGMWRDAQDEREEFRHAWPPSPATVGA